MDDGDDGFCFWDYQPAVGTIGVPLCAEHYYQEHMILMVWE